MKRRSRAMLYLAFVVNYPHFAHSYQIFYRNFSRKAFSRAYPAALRARYGFVGLAVSVALVLFFVIGIRSADARMLGYGANPIWFLVGPSLHSLQYLAVVWRYQIGYEMDRSGARELLLGFGKMYQVNVALFVVLGVILGFLGFWAIPVLLQM